MSEFQRRVRCTAASLTAALALVAAPSAQAVVIAFGSSELTGVYFPGDTFTESGFTFTTRFDFGTVDTAAALGFQAPTGNATQFYFNSNQGALGIAATNGSVFGLSSFAAAFVPLDVPSAQPTVIVAVGTTASNATVTAYWNFGASNTTHFPFTTYSSVADFAPFQSLKSVEFHACSLVGTTICSVPLANNGQFAIDNIVLTPAPVPEPATMALTLTGLLAVAAVVRRRAR